MRNRGEHSIFITYLLSYMLMAAVLCATVIVISVNDTNIMRDALTESIKQDLEKSADTFETRLSELRSTAYAIANEQDIIDFARASELTMTEYARLYKMTQSVGRLYQNNNILDAVYIYFPNSHSVLDGANLIPAALLPYSERELILDGVGYSSYFDSALNKGSAYLLDSVEAVQSGARTSKLFYAVNLGTQSLGKADAYAFFSIDLDFIGGLLSCASGDDAGFMRILSPSGDALYMSGANVDVDMSELVALGYGEHIVAQSGYTLYAYRPYGAEYVYVLGVSSAYFSGRLYSALKLTLVFGLAMIALVIALAYMLTRRNAAPLRRLALMSPIWSHKSELTAISDGMRELAADKERLAGSLRQQRELFMSALFARLIGYGFASEDELEAELALADISPEAPLYAAIYVHFEPVDEENQLGAQVLISDAMRSKLPGALHTYQIDSSNCATFIALKSEDGVEALSGELDALLHDMLTRLHISMWCSIGVRVSKFIELSESYRSARHMFISTRWAMRARVAVVSAGDAAGEGYTLSEEMRHKLFNLCQAGDMEQISAALEHVLPRDGYASSALQLKQLAYDFRALLMRINNELFDGELPLSHQYAAVLAGAIDEGELLKCASDLFGHICAQVGERRQSRSNGLVEAMQQYVDANYHDSELSLTGIAEHFNMNEKYLSRIFREVSGQTLTQAIEARRLARAVELMSDANLLLGDVCSQCGYANMNSFYKAFRRVYGVSPSAYRSGMKEM